jgi:hypothetical protein
MSAPLTKPEKGTPEYELWLCAIEIAVAAPWKKGTYSYSAQIPWNRINKLRLALDGLGIDWQDMKKDDDVAKARVREQHAAEVAARTIYDTSDPSR